MARKNHEINECQNTGEHWFSCICGWHSNKFIPGSGTTQDQVDKDVSEHLKGKNDEVAQWVLDEQMTEDPDEVARIWAANQAEPEQTFED